MMVRKAVAGSVLAAGLGVAGMIGAGSASADPGAAVSVSGIHVGIGDAQASSSFGNAAAAFNGGSAAANGGGVGNVAIASGTNSVADISGKGSFNTAVAVGDDSEAVINDSDSGTSNGNAVFAGGGSRSEVDGNLNLVSNTCAGSTLSVSGTAQIKASPGNVACDA